MHTIQFKGDSVVGVKAVSLYCAAGQTPEVELLIDPTMFSLKEEFDVKITIAPFCPDCKHELRKLIVGKATGTPKYTYVGCICKVE